MPETPNAAVETTTEAAATNGKKAATKKAAKKPAAAKKGAAKKASAKAAKAAKAATKKAAGPQKETVRVRALKALKKKPMTAAQVAEAIGLGHGLKPTLDQEVERGHLAHAPNEESGATTYKVTAKGLKALEAGTVNPPRTAAE